MLLSARDEDGSPMSDTELRDELMTLLVAGTRPRPPSWPGPSSAWAQPEVLGRLTEEIEAGADEAYLTATVQETLRHRPVLPNAAPRLVMRPVEIGGWEYPAGVCLIANGYLIHHDPAIYPIPTSSAPSASVRAARHLHVDPLRRRPPALPGRQLRPARDEDRSAGGARPEQTGGSGDGPTERSRRRAITLSPWEGAVTTLYERRPERVSAYAGR